MSNSGLDGKVVVVTGANNPHGIGAAMAKEFAAQGSKVFLHYFRQAGSLPAHSDDLNSPGLAFYYSQQVKDANEVMSAIRDGSGESEAFEADLSDPTLIPTLFNRAEKVLGPVDVLVNNAADWKGDTFLPANTDLPNKLHERSKATRGVRL